LEEEIMTITVGSYYGISRDTCAQINTLAKRVHAQSSPVPADLFGNCYCMNRFKAALLDKMAAAIATADGKSPNYLMGTHYHFGGRGFFARVIAMEARATALGW
jgi:hypothetical protein